MCHFYDIDPNFDEPSTVEDSYIAEQENPFDWFDEMQDEITFLVDNYIMEGGY